jgi:hypothetical protein
MNKNSSKKRDFPLPRRKESEPGGTGPDGPRRGGGAAIQPFQSDQVDDQARARTLPPAFERGGLSPAPTTSRAKMHGIDLLVGITLKQCPAITIRRRKKKTSLRRECEAHGHGWNEAAEETGSSTVPRWWRAAPC